MPDKKESIKNSNVLTVSGLSGKTFTGLSVWRVGSVDVVEITHSAGTVFIKFRSGQCDVGGDASWGSGTMV